ncbi:N-acetylmuramoyl-L-alanine amidase family protein [Effusibacillus pohliae]|uniref:N-acetylmuramoyl-L-alanine amidase family protein n=1 Tax=Effusibacillus pohliae TaxID=232270 RepID=UPI000365FC18|nr:N-acetylmuramoyl-L-alanine amidase [Effusibacillus pohliae]
MAILICNDPGHGGTDPGAQGNGLQEKTVVLEIALKANERLKAHGFQTIMTRTDDTFIGLSERADMANRAHANYFISYHLNAGGGSGFESYVMDGYDNGETGRIRSVIHSRVAEYFVSNGLPDRGKKQADFAVLRETVMPAVLLELGFIDNGADAEKLKDAVFKSGLVEAIVRGVCEAFGVPYVPPTPPYLGYRVIEDGVQTGTYREHNNILAAIDRALSRGVSEIIVRKV